MSAGLKLRDYQEESLEALYADWATGLLRLAVVLPTGMGKTVVFAHLIERQHRFGRRTLVLVHRDELANQAAAKVHSVAPHLSVGIVKAGRNEVDADVIVGSVQTLIRPSRRAQIQDVGMIIVDEAHHAVARTWMEVLDHFGAFTHTRTAGFSATLVRNDELALGDVWQKVSIKKDILYGIDNGHLVDVRGVQVTVDGLDLATVARSRGDYADGSLGDALESSGAGEVIARAYAEHAGDRQGVLFCPTVSTARSFADDMNAAGIVTEVVVGTTPVEDRNLIYKRYEAGETQVLSNAMVLTEGWDAPHASVAVIARPTSSEGLYTQMVGRVLRPFPGKADALVLDVVGVSSNLRLRSLADLAPGITPRPGESIGEAKERIKRGRSGGKGTIVGTVEHAEVDLFHRSKSAWLQTYAGVWFIPTRTDMVFLWPEGDGTWAVATKPNQGRGGGYVQRHLELGYAMAWGEQIAGEIDPSVSSKKASWRRPANKPTDRQLGMMARLGLPITDKTTKSDASDMISIYFASRELDRHLSGAR